MSGKQNTETSCSTAVPAVQCLEELSAAFDNSAGITKRRGLLLPHWTREGAVYALTFRLADSIPKFVLRKIVEEREELNEAQGRKGGLTPWERQRLNELHSERIEKYLQMGSGECWMKREDIASVVQNALCHFQGKKYDLYCWCVMSNHVHVVLRPYKDFPLEKIVYSWKSFSAKEANKILGRSGEFWSREHYDHLIRNEDQFIHAVEYVWMNPEKAGLKNWKWRGTMQQCTAETAVLQPR